MIVTYWGVRGSVPTPGPRTVRYGGNTSCVAVEVGELLLVIDAGTGIRELGAALEERPREVVLLLTHRHADHVQGLPFFEPLYHAQRPIHLVDHPVAGGSWTLLEVFDGVHVPMRPSQLSPAVRRVGPEVADLLREHGVRLRRLSLHHPGGALGYRVEAGGRSFVHLADSELGEGAEGEEFFRECVEFCRGADVLSHDAQYREAELDLYRGRGHSTVERACDLAAAAGVRRLVLFHHDPGRSDAELDRIAEEAQARLRGADVQCGAAFEGLSIAL